MIPELRPFQNEMVERASAAARQGAKRIVLQAATGAGKTTVAGKIVQRCDHKLGRVLFLAHRRRLVDQISNRLNDFEVRHAVLMRGEKYDNYARINVASRDTMLSRCFRNTWMPLPPADLIIVDEARHAADPNGEYRKILNQYPNAVVLLLDATPVGTDGSGLGPWAQAMVCSPPTTQLIRDGFLVPVKCYAPERKMKRGRLVKGVAGDLVESWKQYAQGSPTVLFCQRVKHSEDAVEAFRAAGIPAEHVDADTPDEDRDRIFRDVELGRVLVVSNVGIIGEGVDVPCLRCCQLFCEVGSRVRFLQACGRIMRPFSGKEYGILIDHAGAVFRHGFPDEDTEWLLDGNVDDAFRGKHDKGLTEQAYYCKVCEIAYKGTPVCPQCGRQPAKPPKSVFAPPPVRPRNEILTEADRQADQHVYSREERIKHWFRCLGMAANRGGSFSQARVVYNRKYGEWPPADFPCNHRDWKAKVADVFPQFCRRKMA